ncbi:MAG: hypothetical protein CMI60_02965 [Parvibaculum sp.]|nr:hypothetical protein [Parvibaculum sp.]
MSETYYGGALSFDTLQLPLGLHLLTEETRELLFFPSLTVFAATFMLLAFRDEDTLSLDARLGR